MANDIGAGVNTQLLATTAVRDLVADRGYPDNLPKSVLMPSFTYTVVSDIPEHHLLGKSGLSTARLQFDFYSDTRKQSNLIAELVRIAIDGNTGTWGGEVVRTCHLENTVRNAEPPIDGRNTWRYVTTQDYMVTYVQSTS